MKALAIYTDNIWLGGNELVILLRNSRYEVIEAYEDGKTVFKGSYKACKKYLEERWIDYQESIIG